MTECSPSIVSAGCFAPLPPLVRLSAPVAASSPVALVRVRVRVRVRLRVRGRVGVSLWPVMSMTWCHVWCDI